MPYSVGVIGEASASAWADGIVQGAIVIGSPSGSGQAPRALTYGQRERSDRLSPCVGARRRLALGGQYAVFDPLPSARRMWIAAARQYEFRHTRGPTRQLMWVNRRAPLIAKPSVRVADIVTEAPSTWVL
jgi:hypothetical protein